MRKKNASYRIKNIFENCTPVWKRGMIQAFPDYSERDIKQKWNKNRAENFVKNRRHNFYNTRNISRF